MKPLNEIETEYWHKYLATLPESDRPIYPFVEASPAGNKSITDSLIQLYLMGKKWAGSSVVEDFQSVGDPLPKVGNYWIVLNSQDQPCLILKTESVAIHKFNDVPESIAIAEGEGDRSLHYWRKAHERIYSPFLEKWGLSRIEDATIVTEFFKEVYR